MCTSASHCVYAKQNLTTHVELLWLSTKAFVVAFLKVPVSHRPSKHQKCRDCLRNSGPFRQKDRSILKKDKERKEKESKERKRKEEEEIEGGGGGGGGGGSNPVA